jgi:hypothetical protein
VVLLIKSHLVTVGIVLALFNVAAISPIDRWLAISKLVKQNACENSGRVYEKEGRTQAVSSLSSCN